MFLNIQHDCLVIYGYFSKRLLVEKSSYTIMKDFSYSGYHEKVNNHKDQRDSLLNLC